MSTLNAEMQTAVTQILQELHSTFKRLWPDYTLEADLDEGLLVASDDFTLFFSDEDRRFLVTFAAGVPAKNAAMITKTIDRVLKHDEYIILDDSYLDPDTNKVVFGLEAYEVRNAVERKMKGLCKCPVCEGVYLKKYFKQGYCLNCHDKKDKLTWQ